MMDAKSDREEGARDLSTSSHPPDHTGGMDFGEFSAVQSRDGGDAKPAILDDKEAFECIGSGDHDLADFELGLDCDTDRQCPVCNKQATDPLLLSCLHSICRACRDTHLGNGASEIKCERCEITTDMTKVSVDFINSDVQPPQALTNPLPSALSDDFKMLLAEAKSKLDLIEERASEDTNSLSELQEGRDNARGMIEETFQSYKAILEECRESSLADLERIHNERELMIMGKLTRMSCIQSKLVHGISYGDKLINKFGQTQATELLPQVRTHIIRTLDSVNSAICENVPKGDGHPSIGATSEHDRDWAKGSESKEEIRWYSDQEKFKSAMKSTFGHLYHAGSSVSAAQPSLQLTKANNNTSPDSIEEMGVSCPIGHLDFLIDKNEESLLVSEQEHVGMESLPGASHTQITVSSTFAQSIKDVISPADALDKIPANVPSLGLLTVGNPGLGTFGGVNQGPNNLQVPSSLSSTGSLSGLSTSGQAGGGLVVTRSSFSSPVHQYNMTRMGASHPDLSLTVGGNSSSMLGSGLPSPMTQLRSPLPLLRGPTPPGVTRGGRSPPLVAGGRGMTPPLIAGDLVSNNHNNAGVAGVCGNPLQQDFSLMQMSERRQSGLNQPNFTLADLLSNASEGHAKCWGDEETGNNHTFNNLAALAKLDGMQHDERWSQGLLLPDLERSNMSRSHSGLHSDPVSPGTHSVSPVLGGNLGVPGISARGASPLSPVDTLMPALGGLSVSPVPPGRSTTGRNFNSMQIHCKFGTLGPTNGQFNSPHGFCLGVGEEIIVADTNNHRIQVFDKNGYFKYKFGGAGKEEGLLWFPRKVAVMKSSGKFVICDRGNERSRMQIFTRLGHFVRKIAIRYIDVVAGLAITRDGNIVAVDSVTPTMFVISENGDLLKWFDCSEFMREPSDITVYGSEFFVCDFKGHSVVVVSEEGTYLRRIGSENITKFPNGIDISDAGDILIGDSHGNRFHVAVYNIDGTLLGEFECPHIKVSRCCGLKITSEGYVVTLAKNNHHVLVLNTLYIS